MAQDDDRYAPWRLETHEPAELNPPDSAVSDSDPDSSVSHKFRITLRFQQRISPSQAGLPSPYRIGPKISVTNPRGIYFGFALDKDPGEKLFWDHSAWTASIPLPQECGRVILGDYLVGFSHGLVINSRRNYGLGWDSRTNLRNDLQGIKPYNGWEEEIAQRGAAIQSSLANLGIVAWGSSRTKSVSLDSTGAVRGFYPSSTDQVSEDSWGFHLEYPFLSQRLTLGMALGAISWNRPVAHYQDYVSRSENASLEMKWSEGSSDLAAQAAWDCSGRSAQMASLEWTEESICLQQAIYRIEPEYFAPLASSLDLGQGEVKNRNGTYTGLAWHRRKIGLSGFLHLWRTPRREPGQSWGGSDLSLSTESSLVPRLKVLLTSRWIEEQEADTLKQTNRWRGLGRIVATPASGWELKAGTHFCRSSHSTQTGQMIQLGVSHDIRFNTTTGTRVSFTSGSYQAYDYSNRLYWNEVDLSGSLRVRSLWGEGQAANINLKIWKSHWGQAAVSLWWNHLESDGERADDREITIVLRYP